MWTKCWYLMSLIVRSPIIGREVINADQEQHMSIKRANNVMLNVFCSWNVCT